MTDHIDLSFSSGSLRLQGTLAALHAEPSPAAVLISGSGPLDRNSNSERLATDVMGQLAAHLATQGFASLRYDKGGVGGSDGDYMSAGFHDNIADARAALAALRARPEVAAGRVFVIGHSEGALIASELASDGDLAGVVLLACTAQRGRDLLLWQAAQVASTQPTPVRWFTKLIGRDLVRTQSKRLDRIAASTDDVVRVGFAKLNAKWLRQFMSFEPIPALRRARVPILAITGSKDLQVDPGDIGRIGRAVPTPFTGHIADDVSHLLRVENGPPSLRSYEEQARQPIDHSVATTITEWMATQTFHASPDRQGLGSSNSA